MSEEGAAGGAAGATCPILDTHILLSNEENKKGLQKYFLKKSSKKLFSRVMLGLMLPGRYYFLTLTSSPESPNLENSWFNFRQWLRYHRPGLAFCFVITSEGYGVIHMVIRLKPRMKNLDINEIRRYWETRHKAKQIKIVRVRHARKLANYLSDQRKKRKLGSEMSWQDLIVRWRWSPGWIPRGFTKEFSKLWFQMIDTPDEIRQKEIRLAIMEAHKNV